MNMLFRSDASVSWPRATATQAVGDRLKISINTVRNYIRSIYDKLHVHSRSEAVTKALRSGII